MDSIGGRFEYALNSDTNLSIALKIFDTFFGVIIVDCVAVDLQPPSRNNSVSACINSSAKAAYGLTSDTGSGLFAMRVFQISSLSLLLTGGRFFKNDSLSLFIKNSRILVPLTLTVAVLSTPTFLILLAANNSGYFFKSSSLKFISTSSLSEYKFIVGISAAS